ncbi:MAG: DUF2203 domain-containing protein [Fimbriiglobus sp.]
MSTPSNRASNSTGKSSRSKTVALDLTTARHMLPLVQGIAADIATIQNQIGRLIPERDLLEDSRRSLDWNGRQRRYAVAEEISRAEKQLSEAVGELSSLGLKLVDSAVGQVDFPTRINNRAAAFSWQVGEDAVEFWHYAGESQRRPIPSDWQSGNPMRVRA